MTVSQPWPGYQDRLWDGRKLAGSFSNFDVWDKLSVERTTGMLAVTAGDDLMVWDNGPSLTKDSDTEAILAQCNWCLKVDSGSAVVEVYTGYDTDWDQPPTFTWTLAATLTISAGRNILCPLPEADKHFNRLFDEGACLLRLNVVSGAADLQSLYLQCEPSTGLMLPTGGFTWSAYETPGLTPLTSDSMGGVGGASDAQSSLDRLIPLGNVRSGAGSLEPTGAPPGTPPNRYYMHHPTPPSPIPNTDYFPAMSILTQERAYVVPTAPPGAFASCGIGYASGLWIERPTYKILPDFMVFDADGWQTPVLNRDYLRDFTASGYAQYGEFEAGDTVAVQWRPVSFNATQVSADPADGNIGIKVGISLDSILLPATASSAWVGTFNFPPAQGTDTVVHVLPSMLTDSQYADFLGTPAPGDDWTVSVVGDEIDGTDPDGSGIGIGSGDHVWNVGIHPYIDYQMPGFRYKIPTFAPSDEAIIAETPAPAPGRYLFPDPNLDGSGLGIEVNFATT